MTRRLLLAAAGVLAVPLLAVAAAGTGRAPAPGAGLPLATAPPRGTFDLARARAFTGFPLYYLGPRFDGIPLVAVLRRADRRGSAEEPLAPDYVSFVYGDCDPHPHGCAPPLEVQVWPACRRHPRALSYTGLSPPEALTVRGVPAVHVDEGGGGRLELTTGTSTVVVFGASREQLVRAAASLRPIDANGGGAREPLPAPAADIVEGRRRC